MECRPSVLLANGQVMPIHDELHNALEDYVNASHATGRPFTDYRPDIGVYLFPSACTGLGIHRRTVENVLQRMAPTTDDNNQATVSFVTKRRDG